jgi:hypothetical protein
VGHTAGEWQSQDKAGWGVEAAGRRLSSGWRPGLIFAHLGDGGKKGSPENAQKWTGPLPSSLLVGISIGKGVLLSNELLVYVGGVSPESGHRFSKF